MPRFIYGNDYGDVGNRQLAYDQSRDQRIFKSLDANRAAAALRQAAAQAAADNEYRNAAMANDVGYRRSLLARKDQDRESRTGEREFDKKLHIFDRLFQLDKFNKELDLESKALARELGDKDYSEAAGAVEGGMVSSDDLSALFPNLSALQKSRLGKYQDKLSEQTEAENIEADTFAKNLNAKLNAMKLAAAKAQITAANTEAMKGPNLPRWMGGGGDERTLTEEAAARAAALTQPPPGTSIDPSKMDELMKQLLSGRGRLGSMVSLDDTGQQFVPARRPNPFRRAPALLPENAPTAAMPRRNPFGASTMPSGNPFMGSTLPSPLPTFNVTPGRNSTDMDEAAVIRLMTEQNMPMDQAIRAVARMKLVQKF